jgi:hypothetical protein
MHNDTDLIFEAYKEIYSEGWKDVVAGASLALAAAMGAVGVKHAATEFERGLPNLNAPQMVDASKVDTYLGKVAHIAGLDLTKASPEDKEMLQQTLKKHYQALQMIKEKGTDSQKKSAAHILRTMQNVAGNKYNLARL